MNFRNAAIMTLSVVVTFTVSAAQQPAGERGRGPADPFAGQPRINALVVSGGCCHDYALQGRLLMDAVSRALPVDWTLVVQGGRGTRGTMPVYAKPDWSKGFARCAWYPASRARLRSSARAKAVKATAGIFSPFASPARKVRMSW